VYSYENTGVLRATSLGQTEAKLTLSAAGISYVNTTAVLLNQINQAITNYPPQSEPTRQDFLKLYSK